MEDAERVRQDEAYNLAHKLPSGWRESWLPADAKPSPAAPCRCAPCGIFRILISPMIVVVFLIVGMSYGPYVLWMPHETLWSQFCVVVFHILVLLLLTSYLMCVFTDPGTTPEGWQRLVASDERRAPPDGVEEHAAA